MRLVQSALVQAEILAERTVGCGYKGCEDVIFAPRRSRSTVYKGRLYNPAQWEELNMETHRAEKGHKQRKLRWVTEEITVPFYEIDTVEGVWREA